MDTLLLKRKKKGDIAVVTDGKQKKEMGAGELRVTEEEKKTFQWTLIFSM